LAYNIVYDDDGDDVYEDADNEGPGDHTKPVKEDKEAKADKAEIAKQGQQAVKGKPIDSGDEKDDGAPSSDYGDYGDYDAGAPGVGAKIGALSAPDDDKGKVKVPKESHDTVIIGLKVYTNRMSVALLGGD